jgi:hypothetical protein
MDDQPATLSDTTKLLSAYAYAYGRMRAVAEMSVELDSDELGRQIDGIEADLKAAKK